MGVGGWVSSIQLCLNFCDFFNFADPFNLPPRNPFFSYKTPTLVVLPKHLFLFLACLHQIYFFSNWLRLHSLFFLPVCFLLSCIPQKCSKQLLLSRFLHCWVLCPNQYVSIPVYYVPYHMSYVFVVLCLLVLPSFFSVCILGLLI